MLFVHFAIVSYIAPVSEVGIQQKWQTRPYNCLHYWLVKEKKAVPEPWGYNSAVINPRSDDLRVLFEQA